MNRTVTPSLCEPLGLPVLSGGDGLDDDDTDDTSTDSDTDDEDDPEDDDGGALDPATLPDDPKALKNMLLKKSRKLHKLSRENAKYRSQRNRIRAQLAQLQGGDSTGEATAAERDSLRVELAFERAARGQFNDTAAAWKLLDRAAITIEKDGSVTGLKRAIESLADAHPFLLATDDTAKDEPNPFGVRSGSTRSGMRRPNPGPNRSTLERRYPTLRNR